MHIKSSNSLTFTAFTRTNKNEIAKVYRGFAKDATEELEKAVYAYNFYQAAPRQVAGSEVRLSPSGDY